MMKCQIIFLISFVFVFLVSQNEAKPTEKVCEPESQFLKDCNKCKCNKDGTDMLCTRKICTGSKDGVEIPKEERKKRDTQDIENDEACQPGEFFKRDCNKCMCPPSGRKLEGVCTLLACFEGNLNA